MKNILSFILAGIFGGLVTLGGFQMMQSESLENRDTPIVRQVNSTTPTTTNTINAALPVSFTEAAEMAMPTVVHIKASESKGIAQQHRRDRQDPQSMFDFFFDGPSAFPFGGPKEGKGSGVIISEDGYIVTNKHVVDFADELEVTLYDDRTFKATKVGIDPRTDLAVIKIDSRGLPAIQFADSDQSKVGEWVLAVGNPFDLTSTVTAGIISAKGRNIGVIKNNQAIENFIQTDAVVNPGNSGGALVDLKGRLVGINTAIATPTGSFAGYSFAIPANMVHEIANHIIQFGGPRAMLGVQVVDMDQELADEFQLAFNKGVFIQRVTDGSAAQYAGVLPNDIITKVDGVHVDNSTELINIVEKAKVGDTLELTIERDGRTRKIPVTLKAG